MPDPDYEITGGGGEWQVSKKFFSAPRALVSSKNKGGARAPRAPSLDPPMNKTQGWTLSAAELLIPSLDHLASLNKLGGTARRVRWTIRKVMGVEVGEVQNKYSCKGEIS